jgi:hypothetical protein
VIDGVDGALLLLTHSLNASPDDQGCPLSSDESITCSLHESIAEVECDECHSLSGKREGVVGVKETHLHAASLAMLETPPLSHTREPPLSHHIDATSIDSRLNPNIMSRQCLSSCVWTVMESDMWWLHVASRGLRTWNQVRHDEKERRKDQEAKWREMR